MADGQGEKIITEGPGQSNPELKVLLDLVQALIRVNKGVVTLTNILGIQKKLMRQYPVILLKFKVDRDFNMTCKMAGTEKELEALGKFLEEYIKTLMELVPPNTLLDKIYSTVKDLGQEAALELLASGSANLLPFELVDQVRKAADFGDRLNKLRTSDARSQVLMVYERLYSRFLSDALGTLQPQETNFKAFCKKLEDLVKSHYQFIREFTIHPDLRVIIIAPEADLEDLLEALAHIYDSLVYGASQVWAPEETRNLGRRVALTVLGEFEEIPDVCGVTASLLRGALSSKVRTGVLGLDRLMDGGLDRNSNTLLVSPNLIERDFLLASFINKGFQAGEDVLVIVSKLDTERLLDMLSENKPQSGQVGKLKLHVFRPKPGEGGEAVKLPGLEGAQPQKDTKLSTGGQAEGEAAKVDNPTDLIELNKFLVQQIKNYGPGAKRALVEVLDEAKLAFGEERLYWYLTRYLNILKENGFSTLFLCSLEVMGKKQITDMLDLFENTLEIRKRSASFSYELGRVAAKKMVLNPQFKLVTFGDRGISVTDD
jgi:KaiC/GvpD/RAD55 family RecA-like ATPase